MLGLPYLLVLMTFAAILGYARGRRCASDHFKESMTAISSQSLIWKQKYCEAACKLAQANQKIRENAEVVAAYQAELQEREQVMAQCRHNLEMLFAANVLAEAQLDQLQARVDAASRVLGGDEAPATPLDEELRLV